MARILITGADGFAGPYVASALAAEGHEIHGLSRLPVVQHIEGVQQWHTANLVNFSEVQSVVTASRPDSVVHLAAISFVAHQDVSEMYLTNVVGTRNVLEALASIGPLAGPTVIVSSANVYGNGSTGALNEGSALDPRGDYALSKVACEFLAKIFADRVCNFVIRPFNYTGVGQSSDFIVPKIVEHVRRRDDYIKLGNIDVARDFSDVRFFARALVKLMNRPPPNAEKVNICSGRAYTLAEVLRTVSEISGHQLRVSTDPGLIRNNEVKKLWGDNSKLTSLIGPLEAPTLEETLRWMLSAA